MSHSTKSLLLRCADSCIPVDTDHDCHVINGSTNILLDTNVTNAKELAYDAIKAALADEEFISSFAPAVASARFIQDSGRDSFVVTPPTPSATDGLQGTSMTATIAIAAASVAFVVMSLFAYGMLRRHPLNPFKGLPSPTGKASPGHIGIKPGSYYEGLDEEQPSLFHLDINSESPSNTWSVSDITSEGSIRSGLSRGTSTLEKIDEETLDEIEMFEDDEETDEDTEGEPLQRSPDKISHFIANFDAVDRRNTSQNNGPHDAMESMDLSQEDYDSDDKEAACTMLPIHMSTEEAQRMLDSFLTPFSPSPNAEDEAKDVPLAALCEANETMDASPIVKEATESSEDEPATTVRDVPEANDARETPPVADEVTGSLSKDEQEEATTLGDDSTKANETPISEGKESVDVDDDGEEERNSGPASSEREERVVGNDVQGEESDKEDLVSSEEEITTDEADAKVDLREDNEFEKERGVDDYNNDQEDDASEGGSDCSPARNVDRETATPEDAKVESKVEDVETPTAPGQDINFSCDTDTTEQAYQDDSDTKADGDSDHKDLGDDEASAATDCATANEEAPVVSPGSSVHNANEAIDTSTNESPTSSEATDQNHVVTTTQENDVGEETKERKETKDETQHSTTTIERVVSAEEPIGLAVRDIDESFDDSLAISTYTAESDEEVSLSGWLATFLSQMNRDGICVSECQTPCQSEDRKTEE